MRNINYVVNLVRLDLGDTSTYRMQKILQYSLLGLRELQLKALPNVEVMYSTPNAANIIPMPINFERYVKIGINLGGRVYTLSLNPDMPLSRKVECGTEVEEALEACACGNLENVSPAGYGYNFVPHYRAGQYVGEFYGQGGGINDNGYFRLDYVRRQIQFQRLPRTEMYIEYVASGEMDGSTLIPDLAVAPIRAYVHWQMLEYRTRVSGAEKQAKKDQYYYALTEYKIHRAPLSIDDILDATYIGRKTAPKF